MNSATLLTNFELCSRKGWWSERWLRHKLDPNDMLRRSITAGLTEETRKDYGEVAGETMMALGAKPGMETSHYNVYDEVVHLAALADIVTQAIRRPEHSPWKIPPVVPLQNLDWVSSAFLDPSGDRLRSFIFASSWHDERQRAEARSWYALGETAVYNKPLTIVVIVLGRHLSGKRHSAWTKGFIHPANGQLRFRRRTKMPHETFGAGWKQIWREDRGDISTRKWLQEMAEDDILKDLCFTIEVPVPEPDLCKRVLEMANRKMERMHRWEIAPEPSLSVCDRPPCPFRSCCWSEKPFDPSERKGFVSLLPLSATVEQ